jgi:hypothetical protein
MSGTILTAFLALGQFPVIPPGLPVVETPSSFIPAPGPGPREDAVLRWNEIALQAIRTDRTPPPMAARNLAIVQAAVYDSVNAVFHQYTPLHVEVHAADVALPEVAAAAAAHRVLVTLYPRQRTRLDELLAADLRMLPHEARASSTHLGEFVAGKVLQWRQNDSSDKPGEHVPRLALGAWRPTPPGFQAALLPAWSKVKPFAVRDVAQFQVPGPPPLGGAAYMAAFREVRALGGRDSTARTAEQTDIARFWADDIGTSTPPGHWNRIAQSVSRTRGLTLAENARLFALLDLSMADAAIVCWSCKFGYDFWRPVTAIRESDETGNPTRPAEPDWSPLLNTPPFPAYTSGHSTFSGAAAAALTNFFGTNRVGFTSTSEGLPGVRRTFTSFSAAAAEAGQSRIYGGIHWQFDNSDGLTLGRSVAEQVCRTHLQPSTPPSEPVPPLTPFLER